MTAIAYIRRSSDRNGGALSFDAQQKAVLDLAMRHGDAEPEVVVERRRSGADAKGKMGGTSRGGKRREWLTIRDRIRGGEVSSLYAYSLSRLARSTKELLDLMGDCTEKGVTVHLSKEGTIDGGSASGESYLTVLAAVATFEASVAAERVKDAHEQLRQQGKVTNHLPFGYRVKDGKPEVDPAQQAVIEQARAALAKHHTLRGAARELNRLGIASPRGRMWNGDSVGLVVSGLDGGGARRKPVKRANGGRGGRAAPPRSLSRLLNCAFCGRYLTPTVRRFKTGENVSWVCLGSRTHPAHPAPNSRAESVLLPLVKAEAARLQVPVDRVTIAEAAQADVADLDAREARLMEAVEAGLWNVEQARQRLDAIEAERSRLEARLSIEDIPQAVDWAWEPAALNEVLHAVWSKVTVDLTALKASFEWRDPSLRA